MARPKSSIQREQRGLRLRSDVMKEMGHLSVDLGKPLNVLVEEAAIDLLAKYGKEFKEVTEKVT